MSKKGDEEIAKRRRKCRTLFLDKLRREIKLGGRRKTERQKTEGKLSSWRDSKQHRSSWRGGKDGGKSNCSATGRNRKTFHQRTDQRETTL